MLTASDLDALLRHAALSGDRRLVALIGQRLGPATTGVCAARACAQLIIRLELGGEAADTEPA